MIKFLKFIRKVYGLSQAELAEKLGVTRSRLSMMELGKRPIPNELVERLSELDLNIEKEDIKLILKRMSLEVQAEDLERQDEEFHKRWEEWIWKTLSLGQPDDELNYSYLHHLLGEKLKGSSATYTDIDTYFAQSDLTRALKVAQRLVNVRGDAMDWVYLSIAFGKAGEAEKSLKASEKAIELDPDNSLAWGSRALALLYLERYDEARDSCKKVHNLNQQNSHAWSNIGLVWVKLGHYEQRRGYYVEARKHYEEALHASEKAIAIDRDNAWAWLKKGVVLFELNRYDDALVSVTKGIEADARNAWAHGEHGFILAHLNRYDDALVSFEKAIKLGDRASYACFGRAEALLALNRWYEGCRALDDALQDFAHSEKTDTVSEEANAYNFAHADYPKTGETGTIIRNLFNNTSHSEWQAHIRTLIEIYNKHDVLLALSDGLMESIDKLIKTKDKDTEKWRMWWKVWRELAGERNEFQEPLSRLDKIVAKQT